MGPQSKPDDDDVNKTLALWYDRPRSALLREDTLPAPEAEQALVKMLWSGVSRGTERLVFEGRVPASEEERMRAPFQDGAFSFPVKYGYCAVGVIERGPSRRIGETVFCLHPHQTRFIAPLDMLHATPANVPPRRATLAANMETALNALWDSGAGPGDEIVVVGAGVLGLLVAFIAAQLPGARVSLIDRESSRAAIAQSFGARFALAQDAAPDGAADVVFHTSASAPGLALALASAGQEATIVELSWYGDAQIAVPLGGAFHAKRLRLISSQVGQVSASRRPRWTYARRLNKALELLADPRLDALVDQEIAFADAAQEIPRILAPDASGLAPVIRY